MTDARIRIIKKGRMIYFQPELRLGWWIFKRWRSFSAIPYSGYLNLNMDGHLYNDYDKAREQFEEYSKLTDKDYRMTHARLV